MKTKYKDNHWGTSVKKLPWDDKANITPAEALISSTMKEWYEAKHRESSKEEIDLNVNVVVQHLII